MANISDRVNRVDEVIDLQGEVCPYTLVKSRLAIEDLRPGGVLEIHLGNGESAANVPNTLDLEGHEVLAIDKPEASHWVVRVRRG